MRWVLAVFLTRVLVRVVMSPAATGLAGCLSMIVRVPVRVMVPMFLALCRFIANRPDGVIGAAIAQETLYRSAHDLLLLFAESSVTSVLGL